MDQGLNCLAVTGGTQVKGWQGQNRNRGTAATDCKGQNRHKLVGTGQAQVGRGKKAFTKRGKIGIKSYLLSHQNIELSCCRNLRWGPRLGKDGFGSWENLGQDEGSMVVAGGGVVTGEG